VARSRQKLGSRRSPMRRLAIGGSWILGRKSACCENGETKGHLSHWKQTIPRNHCDSAIIMISITYDPHCETFCFAWRKIRFVFRGFWASSAQKTQREERPHGSKRCAASRLVGGSSERRGLRHLGTSGAFFEAALRRSERGLCGRGQRREKLRKRAVKPLKSLLSVNLCARANMSPNPEGPTPQMVRRAG
jgi:hypothetical protein